MVASRHLQVACAVASTTLFLSLWLAFVAVRRIAVFKIATKEGQDLHTQTELFERFAGGDRLKSLTF
eukprot:SAG11_NODE_21915_length_416_cov_0.782334_2_plen_66_part_01